MQGGTAEFSPLSSALAGDGIFYYLNDSVSMSEKRSGTACERLCRDSPCEAFFVFLQGVCLPIYFEKKRET